MDELAAAFAPLTSLSLLSIQWRKIELSNLRLSSPLRLSALECVDVTKSNIANNCCLYLVGLWPF